MKDSFRGRFPSAKWNQNHKQWEVGIRSGSRLKQWVNEVSIAHDELVAAEEFEMKEKELIELRSEIQSIRMETEKNMERISKLGDLDSHLESILAELKSDHERFQAVKKAVSDAEGKAQRAKEEITEILSQVLDFAAIYHAKREIERWHKSVSGIAREKFNEAQSVINEQRRRLKAAGWGLEGLDYMAYANFNRPDRDHMDNMPAGAMLSLYRCEQ
jgi:uncharacterized coiled-coil DUF342 family protein